MGYRYARDEIGGSSVWQRQLPAGSFDTYIGMLRVELQRNAQSNRMTLEQPLPSRAQAAPTTRPLSLPPPPPAQSPSPFASRQAGVSPHLSPASAHWIATAAAVDVFPTPPLPPKNTKRSVMPFLGYSSSLSPDTFSSPAGAATLFSAEAPPLRADAVVPVRSLDHEGLAVDI